MQQRNRDDLSALSGQTSTMLREAAAATLRWTAQQKEVARADIYVEMLKQAEMSIALVVKRLQDMNAELDRAGALIGGDEARALDMARDIERFNAEHGEVAFNGRPLAMAMDAPRALLDAQAAMRDALIVQAVLAVATAAQAIAVGGDVAAERFIDKLLEIARDEALGALVPGIGLFLAVFNAARDALAEQRRRAEHADGVLTELEALTARCTRWCEVIEQTGGLLPRGA